MPSFCSLNLIDGLPFVALRVTSDTTYVIFAAPVGTTPTAATYEALVLLLPVVGLA